MIPKHVVEEVVSRLDVIAVIGQRVTLKKEGTAFGGSCPFHAEKTASFKVFPNTKRFKCFGCGESGDVIAFFVKLDKKSFPVVLRELAATVGVEVPDREMTPEQKRSRSERLALNSICSTAADHWTSNLWGDIGAAAREYALRTRGLAESTLRDFRVGYAAADWHDLHHAVRAKGCTVRDLIRAGLVVDNGDYTKAYDRFRDRLMFPIAALDGQLVGFGGRALTFDPATKPGPKYLNGPETAAFKKGRVLFGLDRARDSVRHTHSAILVEGYVDVLALHQAGFTTTVGACGTGLTDDHVQLLKQCGCENLTLLFDGDAAGGAAPLSAGLALLRGALEGRVARIPSGMDPDEFVLTKGKDAVEQLLAGATPLTEFLINHFTEARCPEGIAHASAEQRLRSVRDLVPFVIAAGDETFRNLFTKGIAKRFDLDIGVLRAEVAKAAPQKR